MASRTPVRLDPVTGKKIPPPVSPKPVRMTATRLTRANMPPPAPPQPSTGVKSAEEELDALTDLLVKNLENTSDPDFFGKFVKLIVDASLLFCVRITLRALKEKKDPCNESTFAPLAVLVPLCGISHKAVLKTSLASSFR